MVNHGHRNEPIKVFTKEVLEFNEQRSSIQDDSADLGFMYSFNFDDEVNIMFASFYRCVSTTESEKLRSFLHRQDLTVKITYLPIKLSSGGLRTTANNLFTGQKAEEEWLIEEIDERGREVSSHA